MQTRHDIRDDAYINYRAATALAQGYLDRYGSTGIESRSFEDLVESFLDMIEAAEMQDLV